MNYFSFGYSFAIVKHINSCLFFLGIRLLLNEKIKT